MTASNRGMQFVAVFNDIEGHFRTVLGPTSHRYGVLVSHNRQASWRATSLGVRSGWRR